MKPDLQHPNHKLSKRIQLLSACLHFISLVYRCWQQIAKTYYIVGEAEDLQIPIRKLYHPQSCNKTTRCSKIE